MINNIHYFPKCYPDEDFRSIVYRYHLHSGNLIIKQSKKELFGANNPQHIIPQNVNTLLERLPTQSRWSVNEFLQKHSFYPAFRPFLTIKRRVKIEKSITNTLSPNTSSGVLLSTRDNKLTTTLVRYCPKCLSEDYETFGECYIHRLHQLKDLDICHKHHIALTDCCPTCFSLLSNLRNFSFLATPYCQQGHLITGEATHSVVCLELKLMVLKDYEFLLNHFKDKMYNDTEQMLRAVIVRAGFITHKGTACKKELIDLLLQHISSDTQNEFHITRDILMEKGIYHRLFEPYLFILHPNLFMLMIRFLSNSIDMFYETSNYQTKPNPFGTGPWDCLNKICPNYQHPVISSYKPLVKNNRKNIFGVFSCELCGFTYSKSWDPILQREGNFRIRDWGAMWKQSVLTQFRSGSSFRAIAKVVKVTPCTIKKTLVKMGVIHLSSGKAMNEITAAQKQISATMDVNERNGLYRDQLIRLLKQDPKMTRTDFNNKYKATGKWLRTHDCEWFDKILPSKILQRSSNIDYVELDNLLIKKIQEVAKKVYSSKPRYHIKKMTIIKALEPLDQSRLLHNKLKLPKSWSTIDGFVENLDDYLIRNLPGNINKLQNYGIKRITMSSLITRWEVYEKCSDRVKEELERLVSTIKEI